VNYCDDVECQYYNVGVCTSIDRHHSTDRFCTTGRRRPRDDTRELMDNFKSNCVGTSKGYKSSHGKVLR